jgi:hypothetical protein
VILVSTEAFVVTFHDGCWRIVYGDRWYGTYSDRRSAERAAVRIARLAGELATRVVVRNVDGLEEIIWEPQQTGR